jgi:O-antigen/teichoic acid export membrane protein
MQDEDNLDHLLKTFVKGSFIVFFGVIISKIATYLYKVIIARNFSPEVYGLFSLAILIFGLFPAIFSLGLQNGILRYISFYRGKKEIKKIQSILRFSLNLLFFVSFIGAALLFFFSNVISINIFHNPGLIPFLQIFAIFIPISVFGGMIHVITIAYEKVGWYSFIGNILSPSIQLIFLVIFIFLGLNVQAIIFSYALGILAILLSALFVCKRYIKEIFPKPDIEKKEKLEINKQLFSYSWPIMFLGLAMSLFSLIDSVTIGYFKNASALGLYNAAIPLAVFLTVVPTLFLQLFLPIITKEYSKGNFKIIKDLSKQIGKWIFIINLPITIILVFFPGAVIHLFFGPTYIQAGTTLQFLSIGMFFYSIFLVSENLLSMKGKSKITLFNVLIASIINLVLDILLVPKYGINGAAFSTMLSYLIWGLLSLSMAKKYTSTTPLKLDMLKIILVSIIPTAILFYIRSIIPITILNMIIAGILFVGVYFSIIVLTNSLDKNDLMVIKAIKNKFLQQKNNNISIT